MNIVFINKLETVKIIKMIDQFDRTCLGDLETDVKGTECMPWGRSD